MPLFQCRKCSYTTRNRAVILRHLENKRVCRNRLIKVDENTNFSDLKNHRNEIERDYDGNTSDGSDDYDIASNFTDLTMLDEIFEIIDDKPTEKN